MYDDVMMMVFENVGRT